LSQLRVIHAASLPDPTVPVSWSKLHLLVELRVDSVQWRSLTGEVASHWKRLERFTCEQCYKLDELPHELLELPRLSSVRLIGAAVCDQEKPPELPEGTMVCAGLANHECGMPQWIAQHIQEAQKVTTDVCASHCQWGLDNSLFANINDAGWTPAEVVSIYTGGEPVGIVGEVADDALACLSETGENSLDLAGILRLAIKVSTCEQCHWFAAEKELLERREKAQDIPEACLQAGVHEDALDACDDPNPPTVCHGWCLLVLNAWPKGDVDGSGALGANEVDLFLQANGLTAEGGRWAACIQEATSCMENGELTKPAAGLIGAAVFNMPSSTCEDCQ